ncbi:NAD kinase [Maritalea sp.]|uniref:NAD kinase n=1 Tax=Maritalea sp. TaxID=2003361 RepID=UPI003EF2D23B
MPALSTNKISFVSSGTPQSTAAKAELIAKYGDYPPVEADVIVALGGDGFMLETLHTVMDRQIPVYGMNFGSVGFMMNDFDIEGLTQRLERAEPTQIHPLRMTATTKQGETHTALALNEVSLLRKSYQAAKIEILVDGKTRIDELICDGVLVATPAGSTAYNLSAQGPILPIEAPLLALTPISPFRPRRWRGAILSNRAEVTFRIREIDKRPVNAVADSLEIVDVLEVQISESRTHVVTLLFDPGHSLDERILNEQFDY